LVNLLLNENMKIYRRLRTWLLIIGLILTTVGFLIAQQYSVKPSQVYFIIFNVLSWIVFKKKDVTA
jgi:hypothetical protein